MRKWIVGVAGLVILGLVVFFVFKPKESELGDGYYYLSKYDAMDVGYTNEEAIIYKSISANFYQEIKVHGDVVKVRANKEFILAIQEPLSPYDENKSVIIEGNTSLKYFIILKKPGIVYGPYSVHDYSRKCVELGVPTNFHL